jgi:hypothetical protein
VRKKRRIGWSLFDGSDNGASIATGGRTNRPALRCDNERLCSFVQAIGAQSAFPGRQVISLSGDGGFTMLMGDL